MAPSGANAAISRGRGRSARPLPSPILPPGEPVLVGETAFRDGATWRYYTGLSIEIPDEGYEYEFRARDEDGNLLDSSGVLVA